jgi:hypothetical protein
VSVSLLIVIFILLVASASEHREKARRR